MSLRGIIGMLTTLFVMHSSFASSTAPCAARGEVAEADDMARMPGMAHHTGDRSNQSHDAPVQSPCCQSLGSCVSPFDAGVVRLPAPATRAAAILRGAAQIPLSELTAPEPPPPKA